MKVRLPFFPWVARFLSPSNPADLPSRKFLTKWCFRWQPIRAMPSVIAIRFSVRLTRGVCVCVCVNRPSSWAQGVTPKRVLEFRIL